MANKIQSDKMQWELSIKDSEAQRNIANLAKANKDLEKSNKEIRLEMARLEAQGKRNSDEWRSLNGVLKSNNLEIGNNSKLIAENEKQLGLQNMTMNQLKKRYQELQKEMNNTSKAADPEAWNSLKSKLDETKGAMANLAGGTQKAEGVMVSWGSAIKIGLMGALASLGQKVLSTVGDLFSLEKIISTTQTTGDKYQATMAGLEGAFDQFRRTLATMDFSNFLQNITEAYEVSKKVAEMLDELFERQNSFKIQNVETMAVIEDLYETMNNVNKTYAERQAAGEKIKELTEKDAALQKEILQQEADAYKLKLVSVTKMKDEEIDFLIVKYNENKKILNQASELIKLESELSYMQKNRVKNVGETTVTLYSDEEINSVKNRINDFKKLNQGVDEAAKILGKYNLANDGIISKFVDTTVKVMSVEVEAQKSLRRVERSINTMTKSIADETLRQRKEIAAKSKQEQERLYKEEIEGADKANKEKLISLREMYLAGHISQKEYNAQVEALEYQLIESKIAINLKFSRNIEDLQNQMLIKQIDKIEKFKAALEKLKKEADDAVKKGIAEDSKKQTSELDNQINDAFAFMQKAAETASGVIDSQKTKLQSLQDKYDEDLLALKDSLNLKMLTEQQYNQAVQDMDNEAWKSRFEINSKGAKKVLDLIVEGLNIASQVSSQLQQIEFTKLETQKNRELSLYGDSYDKRAEIEQKYEQKKLEVQQKYADIDMGIKIAQAIASGALGAMTAISQLGVLAGPAVAVIGAMTALQVGMIVAQRNAIKSQTIAGSSGSFGGERMVLGSSQQSSQVQIPGAQKQASSSQISAINSTKGETAEKNNAAISNQSGVMNEISGFLKDLRNNPIAAYTVLSQQEAKKEQFERIKQEGSL
jgi:hypothetical protein